MSEAAAAVAERIDTSAGAASETGAALSNSGDGTATGKPTNGQDAAGKARGSATISDGLDAGEDGEEAVPYWAGKDWRSKLAGEEKSDLKSLASVKNIESLWKSHKELRAKLSDGSGVKKPGKDATSEEVAEYRKAAGLPESPEKLLESVKLPDGRVIGDDDKPVAEDFARAVFDADYRPEQMSRALQWYYDHQEKQQAAMAEEDDRFWADNSKLLKDELGLADYKRTQVAINMLFEGQPEGFSEKVLSARDATGHKIGGDADVLRWLSAVAFEARPLASIMPTGGQSGKSMDTEIAEIQSKMSTDEGYKAYWKDADMQKRYGELLAAREAMQARGSKAA